MVLFVGDVSPPALSFIYQMFSGGVIPPLLYYARNEITKSTLCKEKWHEVTDETERKGVGRVSPRQRAIKDCFVSLE